MRILIVDDSSTMRRIIQTTLTKIGYTEFLQAEDGRIAWEILRNNTEIDIVILDWNMPNMNGLELTKHIRKDDRFIDVPIIMATTEGDRREVITAVKAGVNNYIIKPFTPKVLGEKLQNVLANIKNN
jgi:two-component system chemotaxis response regulator CheY